VGDPGGDPAHGGERLHLPELGLGPAAGGDVPPFHQQLGHPALRIANRLDREVHHHPLPAPGRHFQLLPDDPPRLRGLARGLRPVRRVRTGPPAGVPEHRSPQGLNPGLLAQQLEGGGIGLQHPALQVEQGLELVSAVEHGAEPPLAPFPFLVHPAAFADVSTDPEHLERRSVGTPFGHVPAVHPPAPFAGRVLDPVLRFEDVAPAVEMGGQQGLHPVPIVGMHQLGPASPAKLLTPGGRLEGGLPVGAGGNFPGPGPVHRAPQEQLEPGQLGGTGIGLQGTAQLE
jgi:hypothetical protein